MIHFYARTPHGLYRRQLEALLSAEEVEVRGKRTKELLDVVTSIADPCRRVHMVPGRYWNPFLALSEALHILGGRDDVASLLPYNKNILRFSDDGIKLRGAYGKRIKDQIAPLLDRLRADPHDRRAVLSIWRPEDLTSDSVDPPCNDVVMFKLRNGELHMTVMNRSNDLHWGLYAVNLPTFSILQEYLAARLGVNVGNQTHISNSLHIYLEDYGAKITDRIRAAWNDPLPFLPEVLPLFPNGLPSHQEFVRDCNAVLDQEEYGGKDPEEEGIAFLEFASDFLRCYREFRARVTVYLEESRHAYHYADWVEAGQEFLDWLTTGSSFQSSPATKS